METPTISQGTKRDLNAPVSPFYSSLGATLRRVRHTRRMSLADVEAVSNGHFKAVVLGAYERGSRRIAIETLFEVADFYKVELASLLPNLGEFPDMVSLDEVQAFVDSLRGAA